MSKGQDSKKGSKKEPAKTSRNHESFKNMFVSLKYYCQTNEKTT